MQARWDAGLRPGGGAYPPSPPGISSASPSPSRSPSPSPSPSLSPTSLQSATFSAYDEPTSSPLQIAGPSYNSSKRRSSQYTQHPTSITTPFTPTSPHGTAATQPVKIPRQALSPPTPAPSPTPAQRCYVPLPSKKGAEQQSEDNANALLKQFRGLSKNERFAFLSLLVGELHLNEALDVSSRISPRLKRDFLSDLPVELALHCVSFIDDARSLGRAMRVCKSWQALLQDENKWKDMHDRKLYRSQLSSQQAPQSPAGATFPPSMYYGPERSKAAPFVPSWRLSPASPSIRQPQVQPQTYREKFRDAYLTESNWLHGGRLLTRHSSMGDSVVTSLVVSDELIIIGMGSSEIHVFDATTGHHRQSLRGHESGVWGLVLVEPPKRSRGREGAASAKVPQSGGEGSNSASRRMPSSDVCGPVPGWGIRRSLVVSGGCDRDVRVWDLATGQCVWSLPGHSSTIRCLKVLEGRPIAISGSRDSTLRVWDIDRGRLLHVLEGHDLSVRCLEVAGNQVVSGSYDYTCRLWDVDTGECLQVFEGHYHQIYAVAFDGERVMSGSLDSTVRVWDAASGECLAILQGHTSLVGQLQLSGDLLMTGGSDGRVIMFDLNDYSCVNRICAHDNSVTCLQFDDRFIVSGGNDGRIKLWDVTTGAFIRELTQPCEVVWRIGFRNDKCAILCQRNGRTVLEVLDFRPNDQQIRPGTSRPAQW